MKKLPIGRDEPEQEFVNLRTEAYESLRRGFQEGPWDRRIFQLVVLPSFEASYSWELYERKTKRDPVEAIAVHAIWHTHKDLEKFDPVTGLRYPRKLSPTITVGTSRIEPKIAQKIVETMSEIVVPIHPGVGGVYLDGKSYELTVGRGSDQARFAWHEEAPSHWESLRNWALKAVSDLEAASRTANPD